MSEQIQADEATKKPKKRRRWVRVLISILVAVGGLICLVSVVVIGGVGYFIWDFASGPGRAGRALLTAIVEEDYTEALLHAGSQYGDSPAAFEQRMAELGMNEVDRIKNVRTTGSNEGGSGSAEAVVIMEDGTERTIRMGAGYRSSAPMNWVISTIGFAD
ncbi:MAG: hypothetical protein AAF787_22815, partial [Chloroflexota bacterium]